ncbi:MAG: hypothetical protein IT204_12455 [Fimbriimonadaceae bacterium]|nr:hypothetical protein [Fimbriimonadaceae bacterium]
MLTTRWGALLVLWTAVVGGQEVVPLPPGVSAVWDPASAVREATATRERICVNGLWRWQPAGPEASQPSGRWGWFKVPGEWPGITDYLHKDCQTVHRHPAWAELDLASVTAAWYQREITIPAGWAGRRLLLAAEYVNSLASVYLDGREVGLIRFPAGRLELGAAARPGQRQVLTLRVEALPLRGVLASYNNTNEARQVRGSVARRGLCGDLWLCSEPTGPRLEAVRLTSSVRQGTLTASAVVAGLPDGWRGRLRATVTAGGDPPASLSSPLLSAADRRGERLSLTAAWRPSALWDLDTPGQQYTCQLELLDATGTLLDTAWPERSGFREFWIDGRDFYLNGTRLTLCALPLDNAQVGAAWATYEAAKESLQRLQSYGINFVYTHNYGCEPGAHLSFAEILRAADDVGMLVGLSQPHFGHYDWAAPDADRSNGYAAHADFYCGVAGSHPSVVLYATSHNATGYAEDMNPDLIDGVQPRRTAGNDSGAATAVRVERLIGQLDASRPVYHHSSGYLGTMHTSNFYPNWAPQQELNDWFEHWATAGARPCFLVEYGAPFTWDWALYRGWYNGVRNFGSAVAPWDFCLAEWQAQFVGDAAWQISDQEARNVRWEAQQYRAGRLWHRWDYPHQLGSSDFDERYPVLADYYTQNWRAYRTWGVSAISPWEHGVLHKLRPGVNRNARQELPTDWSRLQRPGFSPDYLETRYERMDLAYDRADWQPTAAAAALQRNNQPVLAWIAGPPEAFTAPDHLFTAGETVVRQLILINNSRHAVSANWTWQLDLPQPLTGRQSVTVAAGQQHRLPLPLALPADLPAGVYHLTATAELGAGGQQTDQFTLDVLPPAPAVPQPGKVALWDPRGTTGPLLQSLGVAATRIDASSALDAYDLVVIGQGALTPEGPAPDLRRVRAGLKVLLCEQTAAALEQRLGFRVAEYGLRQLWPRVAGHPALAGLDAAALRAWRGAATLNPARLDYQGTTRLGEPPTVKWCGFDVPRVWRCGNRGNVASVVLEKPARGDFLTLVDGGFGQQYAALLEYREGRGVMLLCQLDISGRTAADPAAQRLAGNLLRYLATWQPASPRRLVYAGDEAGRQHLAAAGLVAAPLPAALAADQLLLVDRAGAAGLGPRRAELQRWLASGGKLVALGLDPAGAAALPGNLRLQPAEHLAAAFGPQPVGSPFAGCAAADIHNRDPRELPLVTAGAAPLGNGVLAASADGALIVCQLPPWEVSRAAGAAPSLVVEQLAAGAAAGVLTMGTVPLGQVGQKLPAPAVGTTCTFTMQVEPMAGAPRVRLEVERAGRPWDRAYKGPDQDLPAGRVTELRATFPVAQAFAEGWQAYLAVTGEGARLRIRSASLRPAAGQELWSNGAFSAGSSGWWFRYETEQQNLRRTWRGTSRLLTRLLANAGVPCQSPLLDRLSTPVAAVAGPSAVRNGTFAAAGANGVPAEFSLSVSGAPGWQATLAAPPPGAAGRALSVTLPRVEGQKPSLMLAQSGVALTAGTWYRLSLRARAEDLTDAVTVTVQNTNGWRAVFDYQRLQPTPAWQQYSFLLLAKETVTTASRYQVWTNSAGRLDLADLHLDPVADPTAGRWREGCYLDQPQPWDDPYRFFRW